MVLAAYKHIFCPKASVLCGLLRIFAPRDVLSCRNNTSILQSKHHHEQEINSNRGRLANGKQF